MVAYFPIEGQVGDMDIRLIVIASPGSLGGILLKLLVRQCSCKVCNIVGMRVFQL